MLRVSKFHKSTIYIDGEACRLRIHKLAVGEFTKFAHEFERLGKLHNAEQLELRPRPDEDGLKPEQIAAKRYGALSVEERRQLEAEEIAENDRSNEFAIESICKYVTLEPEQVYDEDAGRSITTGEEIVAHFGSRPDVLRDVVAEIFLVNRLSEADKKKLQLLRASMRTSSATAAATGNAPAPTAGSAEPLTSAPSEAASEGNAHSPSGSTDL